MKRASDVCLQRQQERAISFLIIWASDLFNCYNSCCPSGVFACKLEGLKTSSAVWYLHGTSISTENTKGTRWRASHRAECTFQSLRAHHHRNLRRLWVVGWLAHSVLVLQHWKQPLLDITFSGTSSNEGLPWHQQEPGARQLPQYFASAVDSHLLLGKRSESGIFWSG